MKTIIKDILDTINYQWVAYKLPPHSEELLYYYGWAVQLVEPNSFVLNSLSHFIKEQGKQLRKGDIKEIETDSHIHFGVLLPGKLWFKLKLLSFRLGVSHSTIINEALGFSLPNLIEIEQAQEDYMFEQADNLNITIVRNNND